ncbi:TIM-barrel domain-containing protein [Thalassomonas sp. RHCl1]|uniref:TIM-barrel domain-containing protein n=1 Tax=Thalassomonas sp. RHCl1 TaxID=2995320 RepID=UPI00248C698B|nr:TIM-barrel domain-containing protein [Thalassomonas sp. RHCl1]
MKLLTKLLLALSISLSPALFLPVQALAPDTVTQPAFAEKWQSYRHQGNTLVLHSPRGQIAIEYITDNSVYVHYQANGVKQLPGYLLDEKRLDENLLLDKQSITTSVTEKTDALSFSSTTSSVVIQQSPFKLAFYHQGQLKLEEELGYIAAKNSQGFRFKLTADEKLFAGGQRVLGMDRRGFKLPLYNKAHYGYENNSKQMYFGLPGLMSSNKYMLMFDNSAKGSLDLGASEQDILAFSAGGGRTAYLVTMADDYADLLDHYTSASGKQPMPPMWALGSMASRFGYRSEAQARAVVAEYQKQNMPLDAIIFDLYWFGPDIKGHMGNLDWDRKTFPHGEQMVKDFADMGIQSILISEPFVLTSSGNWQAGSDAGAFAKDTSGKAKTFDFYFGNTSLVDIFSETGQNWFWPFYQKQLDWGIAGFWGDLGEPEVHPADAVHSLSESGQSALADEVHNVYGHQWAKTLYQGFNRAKPKQRPFIMMRSGFAGSQRYGMIPWTGDVSRSWAALASQVELSLQMGLLGLGYTHSDLGGFVAAETFDAELYVRWLQFGAFSPVFRPHADDSVLPEPVFHGEEVAARVKEALSWRYQLLPYNYTLAWENHSKGTPLMRPVFFEDDTLAGDALLDTKAYFWGPNLLVLPVTAPGVTALDYQLLAGNWYDYFTGKRYSRAKEGAKSKIPVNKETIPVLVKGGAIIPHAPDMQNTREYSGDELIIHYWFDAGVGESRFQLYQDDGQTQEYQQGEFTKIDFVAKAREQQLSFNIALADLTKKQLPGKQLSLVVHNAPHFKAVYLEGKRLNSSYDHSSKQLKLSLTFDGKPLALTFN